MFLLLSVLLLRFLLLQLSCFCRFLTAVYSIIKDAAAPLLRFSDGVLSLMQPVTLMKIQIMTGQLLCLWNKMSSILIQLLQLGLILSYCGSIYKQNDPFCFRHESAHISCI